MLQALITVAAVVSYKGSCSVGHVKTVYDDFFGTYQQRVVKDLYLSEGLLFYQDLHDNIEDYNAFTRHHAMFGPICVQYLNNYHFGIPFLKRDSVWRMAHYYLPHMDSSPASPDPSALLIAIPLVYFIVSLSVAPYILAFIYCRFGWTRHGK